MAIYPRSWFHGAGIITALLIVNAGCRFRTDPIVETPDNPGNVPVTQASRAVHPEAITEGASPVVGKSWVVPSLNITIDPIKAGTFRIGALESIDTNVTPSHLVTISRPFWIGRYEITQEQYGTLMGNNPSVFIGLDRPAESMSWYDAKQFCLVLNVMEAKAGRLPEGYVYRLPTEAEWEYACGEDMRQLKLWELPEFCWHARNSDEMTHPVGMLKPNRYGVYDMLGNVAEWCSDREGAYSAESVLDPTGPEDGQFRVVRGGNWYNNDKLCAATSRFFFDPLTSNQLTGFRIVLAHGEVEVREFDKAAN